MTRSAADTRRPRREVLDAIDIALEINRLAERCLGPAREALERFERNPGAAAILAAAISRKAEALAKDCRKRARQRG